MKKLSKKVVSFLAIIAFTLFQIGGISHAFAASNTNSWVKWIKNNHKDIKSLDSENFSDLEFLKNVLKGKQVVYLGESFHGIGDYNTVKVRLIKFLHQEMGFNVLAFESDLGTCSAVNEDINGMTPRDAMLNSILGVWGTQNTLPLFDYLKKEAKTKNKLNLTGFDMQPNNMMMGDYFSDYAYDMLSKLDKKVALQYLKFEVWYLNTMLNLEEKYGELDSIPQSEMKEIKPLITSQYDFILKYITANRAKFVKLNGEKKVQLCERELSQRTCLMDMISNGLSGAAFQKESYEYRDRIMAKNLEWIMQKQYPGQKVIVWEHNEHMSKNTSKGRYIYGKKFEKQFVSMGEIMDKKLKDKAYHLALYLNRGTAAELGSLQPYNVGPMPEGTVENLFAKAGCKNAFVDLSNQKVKNSGNSWMFKEMAFSEDGMTGTKIEPGSLHIVPKEQYDGILYLDEVHAPQYQYN